jgi:hypothetical protein
MPSSKKLRNGDEHWRASQGNYKVGVEVTSLILYAGITRDDTRVGITHPSSISPSKLINQSQDNPKFFQGV